MAMKRTTKKVSIQEEDLNMLREIYTMVGEMKGIVETTRDQTAENTRTLRGHNGTPGLLTMFCNLDNKVNDVDGKIEAVKVAIKDIPAAIDTMKHYPSLTWMVRHKFKEMAIITAGAILLAVFIGFPDRYVSDRLQLAVELLFAKWLGL
jgi:hypothetical protein